MITTTITCDHCRRQIPFRDYSAETWHVESRALGIGWTTADGEHTCPACVAGDAEDADGIDYSLIHDHVGGQDD